MVMQHYSPPNPHVIILYCSILYDSINNKIKPLSEDILIYPAHGAGSQCGKNMMKETVDTLGNQKNINYVFSDALVKDDFIKQLTDDLPEPPAYFSSNVKLNKDGYQDISLILEKSNKPLSVEEFDAISKEKEVVIIDARHQDDFAKTHIPNSIFIGLDGDFAPWAGEVISDIKQPILLVVDKNREKEAIIRLSRVGFDNVIGYLDGGVSIWKDANKEVANVATITAKDFEERQKLINSMFLM